MKVSSFGLDVGVEAEYEWIQMATEERRESPEGGPVVEVWVVRSGYL